MLANHQRMSGDRVLTLHPQGKKGRRIDAVKYQATREAVIGALSSGDLTQNELVETASAALEGRFEGSKGWYVESVKLDLEARGLVERYRSKPHDRYRLVR